MDINALVAELTAEEGSRLKPYRDSVGKLTIGVGRNLDDVGISPSEEAFLLANDLRVVCSTLDAHIPWWRGLSEPRQQAVADMCFNMGWPRLSGFHNMLAALQRGDWASAAAEALDSEWAKEVGSRATVVASRLGMEAR